MHWTHFSITELSISSASVACKTQPQVKCARCIKFVPVWNYKIIFGENGHVLQMCYKSNKKLEMILNCNLNKKLLWLNHKKENWHEQDIICCYQFQMSHVIFFQLRKRRIFQWEWYKYILIYHKSYKEFTMLFFS